MALFGGGNVYCTLCLCLSTRPGGVIYMELEKRRGTRYKSICIYIYIHSSVISLSNCQGLILTQWAFIILVHIEPGVNMRGGSRSSTSEERNLSRVARLSSYLKGMQSRKGKLVLCACSSRSVSGDAIGLLARDETSSHLSSYVLYVAITCLSRLSAVCSSS